MHGQSEVQSTTHRYQQLVATGKHGTLRRVWYRVLTFVFHHGTLGTVIMCAFCD
jgi:hypothetical protein